MFRILHRGLHPITLRATSFSIIANTIKLCRYIIASLFIISLLFFNHRLPFTIFPLLFIWCFFLGTTIILELFSRSLKRDSFLLTIGSFIDMVTIAITFHYTGGFISFFVLISLVLPLSSISVRLHRHLPIQYFFVPLSYLLVSQLHKYRLIANPFLFSAHLMQHNSFYYCFLISSFISSVVVVLLAYLLVPLSTTQHDTVKRHERLILYCNKSQTTSRMTARIVHDFNNIIAAINGYASLLKKKLVPGERIYSYVEQILEATGHASAITTQLSLFVKDEHNKAIETVEVLSVIANVVSAIKSTYNDKCRLEVITQSLSLFSLGKASLLNDALLNICRNSFDASSDREKHICFFIDIVLLAHGNPICRIFSITGGKYIRIRISDKGCGMNDAILNRIFDPFFTTKQNDHNIGTGLSAIWNYIETYKGAIDITSKPNKGTSVIVYLPLPTENSNDGLPTNK